MRRAIWISVAAIALSSSRIAGAAPVWIGDFETSDTSQWDGELNGEGHISIVGSPIIQGAHAAQIQLTNDAVWPNGLKRVELHHGPAAGRTAEGQELYFAWSFYLPETLPTDPAQQIGYWESNQSYQQIMAFNVAGEHVQFITQKPNYTVHWESDGMATAGEWHRIAMHVLWSKDPSLGKVDVWFDGQQVVSQAGAQTLADDNDHFTQVGLLRGPADFTDMPIIVLDDAVEGDSLEDVHPDLVPTGEGGAGGGSASGGGSAEGGAGGASSAGGAPSQSGGDSAVGGSGNGETPSGDDEGCGCRVSEAPGGSSMKALAISFLAIAWGRRRLFSAAKRGFGRGRR